MSKKLHVDKSIHEKLGMKTLTKKDIDKRKKSHKKSNKCKHEYEFDGGQCINCGEQGGLLNESETEDNKDVKSIIENMPSNFWSMPEEAKKDINIIKYETFHENVDYNLPSIFLAGPTVRGNQPHLTSWRIEAVKIFEELGFKGNLIIPEFSNKYESDEVRYDLPLWEFEGLKKSHVIMFWIPRTRELIGLTTNHEMGYWMARDRMKIVYGRPRDAYRMSYLDIMWVEDYKDRFHKNHGAKIHTTLEGTIKESIRMSYSCFS